MVLGSSWVLTYKGDHSYQNQIVLVKTGGHDFCHGFGSIVGSDVLCPPVIMSVVFIMYLSYGNCVYGLAYTK